MQRVRLYEVNVEGWHTNLFRFTVVADSVGDAEHKVIDHIREHHKLYTARITKVVAHELRRDTWN